jgi:hypothetical protein
MTRGTFEDREVVVADGVKDERRTLGQRGDLKWDQISIWNCENPGIR